MPSIKKVLCLKVKDTCPKERLFTPGIPYDVVAESMMLFATGRGFIVNDNFGRPTTIIIGDGVNCIYGEWQQLEEYVCMTQMFSPKLNRGDTLYGYAKNGVLYLPNDGCIDGKSLSGFKKLSEIPQIAQSFPQYEVRHVIYDTKENKIVNDAMGECYITLAEAQELCDEMNAPKVMKPKYTKEVEYFGMKILVPDDAKSIAVHKDGGVFVSDELMYESLGAWETTGYLKHICIVDLNGIDWKDTLVEIK